MKSMKRFLVLLLALLLLLTTAACGDSITNTFDDGAQRFGAGKEEENYYMPNSGVLLQQLIDEFSGSLEPPFSKKMSDDDYDEARKRAEEDAAVGGGTTPGGDPSQGGTTPDGDPSQGGNAIGAVSVSNDDELMQVFRNAYVPTEPRAVFTPVNGYDPQLDGAKLNFIYRQLQREDPIGIAGVSGWSTGERNGEYIVEISYYFTQEELNRIKSETPGLVDKAIAEMNVSSTDHYDIICAVNEYLCDIVVYPPNEPYHPLTHTPYGGFKGDGVCEAYATAAKLMLNELGIRCDIQTGTCIGGGGHAWNLVELEGQWYQLDICWNDGGGRRTDYLLVTDSYMKASRTWDESIYPRSAAKAYQP